MIRLPLQSIQGDNGPGITVATTGDGDVVVEMEAECVTAEHDYGSRSLTPSEARALAAMLLHFAEEASA